MRAPILSWAVVLSPDGEWLWWVPWCGEDGGARCLLCVAFGVVVVSAVGVAPGEGWPLAGCDFG